MEEAIEEYKEEPGDDSKIEVFFDSIRAKIALKVARYETKKGLRRWKRLELKVVYSLIRNRND